MFLKSIYRFSIPAIAAIVLAGSMGCKDDTPRDQNTDNNPVVVENNNPGQDHDKTHGPDDNAKFLAAGFLNGSWRIVKNNADRTPVMYWDLVHDEGNPKVDGTFEMGIGLEKLFKGQRADIMEANWQNDKVALKFNPSNQKDLYYNVASTKKVDANTLEGTLTSDDGKDAFSVLIIRQLPDNN